MEAIDAKDVPQYVGKRVEIRGHYSEGGLRETEMLLLVSDGTGTAQVVLGGPRPVQFEDGAMVQVRGTVMPNAAALGGVEITAPVEIQVITPQEPLDPPGHLAGLASPSLEFRWLTIECRDPLRVAKFWSDALQRPMSRDTEGISAYLHSGNQPSLYFKEGENVDASSRNFHLGLMPLRAHLEDEIERLSTAPTP
ncbi:VOC family protein [Streptomyces sp. NPDC059008]|uniref:VOC family protein n=1 Tax=Streptomyces sp. NPDC059008 TaxID=3346693 RepID=UPI00369050BA